MVVTKQLIQIPVCLASHSVTTFSHNAEIVLPTLSFKEVMPTAGISSSFFQSALEFQMESGHINVKFFELQSAEGAAMSCQGKSLVADKCFVAAEDSIAFVEASCPVNQNNKESLSTLFDLVDESGCSIFIACVQRDRAGFADIVKSYLMLGFQMTQNWSLPNYVLLGKEL